MVAIILVTLSLLLHPNEQATYFRGLRSIVSLIFLGFIVFTINRRNHFTTVFCLMYSASSILTIWYEHQIVSVISMLINALAILILARMVYKKIRSYKMSKVFLSALVFVALVNVWLMYSFLLMLHESNVHMPLLIAISVGSISFFAVTILAFIHTHESHSPASIVFIFFLIFLMFAEMFRGVGYYNFVDSVYGQYAARILLVIAFLILSYYSFLERKKTLI